MFKDTLNQLLNGQDLSHDQMLAVMQQVMGGELTSAQISAFLIALRLKGETVDEIAAAATVMRQLSTKVNITDKTYLVDTCGTGGSGIPTFNVSTVSAFVASAAGATVAKHGGRSASSICGSADILELLGVDLTKTAEQVGETVDAIGVGFMFAQNHHSAMKHAAPVRRELGVSTMFNVLGPLTNPASARRQVLGVFNQALTGKLAQVLQKLGSEHVLAVHGADGVDEISFTGDTYVAELKGGKVTEYTINPTQFGLATHQLKDIEIKSAEDSKAFIMDVLNGQTGAARDIVLLNAGAAIYVSGVVDSLQAGIAKAGAVIDDGTALAKLEALKAA